MGTQFFSTLTVMYISDYVLYFNNLTTIINTATIMCECPIGISTPKNALKITPPFSNHKGANFLLAKTLRDMCMFGHVYLCLAMSIYGYLCLHGCR